MGERKRTGFRMQAHACRIYGVIKMTGGDLSAAEMSRRLGIPYDSVIYILRKRGWRVRDGSMDFTARRAEDDPKELDFTKGA